MRRARWTVLATAVVLLLSACAAIPTDSDVRSGATALPNDTSINFLPNPPSSGASQTEIVNGFLAAGSAGGAFRVAKQYLATSFAATWRPQTVLIQTAQPTITTISRDTLALAVPTSGRVDEHQVYTPSTKTARLTFHLVQQAGQWRIDAAPDSIVLGQTVFQKVYAPQVLQYFDPTWTRLVPDVRWFPSNGSTSSLKAAEVQALVAGPQGPVAGGVTVNALAGATVGTVRAAGDETTVVLNVAAKDPTGETKARMQQQLVQSLGLPTPAALRLFVNGVQVAPVKAPVDEPMALNAYVVADGRFGELTASGAFTAEPTLGPRIAALEPEAVTFSLRQRLAAVQNGSGDVAVVAATGTPRVVDSRAGLVPPTLDQRRWVYSVPRAAPDHLIAFSATGQSVDLAADLGGTSVDAIEVSPDGTRMVVLIDSATGPEAFVAGIERKVDGTPTGLTASRYAVAVGGAGGRGVDATWVDDSSVAVLSSSLDGTIERVQVQHLGAGDAALGPLANALSIVGTLDETYLRVRLQTGDLWTWTSNLWQSQGSKPVDVSVLAVQR